MWYHLILRKISFLKTTKICGHMSDQTPVSQAHGYVPTCSTSWWSLHYRWTWTCSTPSWAFNMLQMGHRQVDNSFTQPILKDPKSHQFIPVGSCWIKKYCHKTTEKTKRPRFFFAQASLVSAGPSGTTWAACASLRFRPGQWSSHPCHLQFRCKRASSSIDNGMI